MPVQHDSRFPYRTELEMPVMGLEAEFKVFVDEKEVAPEDIWRTPSGFISQPLLRRSSKASQLPTGGAVYFDGGVIEVVTPVIELAPQCTARAVRSLWEQIGFVRDELDKWEASTGRRVRLQAFSCHVNISFELGREERSRDRTIQKLAYLLMLILPVPVLVAGENKRSTGLGVRPRRDRIEMTLDFTPDPGLMAATAALIVGIVREVIGWPSYRVEALDRNLIPLIDGIELAKHPSRNGWVVRDYHFPRNPFETDIDEVVWETTAGKLSFRQIAERIANAFRESIREHADPFSDRVLFALLTGETPSLLQLDDRPPAYDDVGRSTRWGSILPELENFGSGRRKEDIERLAPPWRGEPMDRRADARGNLDRRSEPPPSPSPRLTRSAYESVFMKLASGKLLQIGDEVLTPVAMKGWYHSIFRTESGEERMLSIDQIMKIGTWSATAK